MPWEDAHAQPVPPPYSKVLRLGDLLLSVSRKQGASQYYCHALMTAGKGGCDDAEECLANWPREAIAIIRAKCDEVEAELDIADSDGDLDA